MPRRRFHATLSPSSASLVTTLTCGFPYHSHNASWPRGGPRTPLCAPVSQAAQQLKNPPSMIWRQCALTCRAALPTYSIGMRLLHRHKNAHTLTHIHTLMGDMRPADAATVSGDTFLTAIYLSGRVSQLSPASACCCDCCCCCCWRSLTHFFSVVRRHRSADRICRLRNAACDRTDETWKHYSVAAFLVVFCPTRVSGPNAHFGRSPTHRVSCASLWPCGVFSVGAHFSLPARLFHAPKLSIFSHETQHLRRFSTQPLAFSFNFPS